MSASGGLIMQGKRFLRSIGLKNLLSYGSEGVRLDLEPLNVLIGQNAAGKSNLIEAISLLAATPRDLMQPIRRGGGVLEWLWKGVVDPQAELDVDLDVKGLPVRYGISFTAFESSFHLVHEELSLEEPERALYQFREGGPRFLHPGVVPAEGLPAPINWEQSVFSQLKDPLGHPELTETGRLLGQVRLFRGFDTGPNTALRRPQSLDQPDDFLLEDGSNLGLVLNKLKNRPATKRLLLEQLKLFYEGIEDVETQIQGGTVQVFIHEHGDRPIPATRLSDGTLTYLCLLSILCHPDPPPLVCFEEPETELHPDIIPSLADLLKEASKRTQIIVTTHSDALVSSLNDVPEAIVVCERRREGTSLRRLEPDKLKEWLKRYSLGELWSMGEIGGNRW